MTFFYVLIASFVVLVIAERILIHSLVYKRKQRVEFRLYYLLSFYKPFLAMAAISVFLYVRGENPGSIAILVGLALLTPLVSYPIARFFFNRQERRS